MMKFKKVFFLFTTMTLMAFSLVGCGSDKKDSTTQSGSTTKEDGDSAAGDIGTAVENAVDDVVDGAEDLVSDAANGFDNYDDAHDYFLKRMGQENSSAKYELRNETKDLEGYADGKNGYSFELYDTSKNKDGERVGKFYIDNKDGSVYKAKDGSKGVEPYTLGNGTDNNNGTGTGSGAGTGTGTDGGTGTGSGTDAAGTGGTTGNSTGSNGGNTSGNTSGN